MEGCNRASAQRENRPAIRLLGRLGICILALASTGFTWEGLVMEYGDQGWVVALRVQDKYARQRIDLLGRRERQTIEKGAGYALCDKAKVLHEGERACVAGTFDLADGRGALDLDALTEEVADWCLAIAGNLSDCRPLSGLRYVVLAHRAEALRADDHHLEAATRFRKAADLATTHGHYSVGSDYKRAALEVEAEYLESVDASVDRLVDAGDLEAAIRLLKQSSQLPTALRRFEDGYSAKYRFTERANELELVRARNEAQLAELEECELLGEADRVLTKGRNGQRVWFCPGNLGMGDAVAVWDGVELLGTFTFDFSERYHWLGKATLADVTGTPLPELLVEIEIGVNDMEGDARRQGAGMYGWPDGETFERLWRYDGRYDSVEWEDIDWWPNEKTALPSPTPKIANDGFTLEGVPMVWDETSRRFLPAESQRSQLREQQLKLARTLLKQGKPWAAYLALPEDAPSELGQKVEAGCERAYLAALRKAQARDDELAKAWGELEFQEYEIEMLDRGLECAPRSTHLRRQRDKLVAQLEEDKRRAAEAGRKEARLERFAKQEVGPFRFGMNQAQARVACYQLGGRWDGGSGKLVACDVQIMPGERGTYGAGFCGDRACSLHYQARALGKEWTFYRNDMRSIENKYGEGKSRRAGEGTVTEWRLDPKKTIRVTLTHDHGRGRYSIAMHSNGER